MIGRLSRNFASSPFSKLLANILFPTRCEGILMVHQCAKFHTHNYNSSIAAAVKLRKISHDSHAVILQFRDITWQNFVLHNDPLSFVISGL